MVNRSDIITSPEAAKMLGRVTKGFYDQSYTALWMFEVIGHEYDEIAGWTRGLRDEIFPQTCTWSLPIWEWIYGFEPDDSLPMDYRRQRILAHIVGESPINPEVIRRGVAALTGAGVEVFENTAPYTFEVVVSPTEKPLNYFEMWRYIRSIKPSHLSFNAYLETKVNIRIEMETRYNLLGFGLTGQYNCGTRPDINVRAQLRDVVVDILQTATGALFAPTPAGTKPNPNILFNQDTLTLIPDIWAAPYTVPFPFASDGEGEGAGESAIVAGTYPNTQYKGGAAGGGIQPKIVTENYTVAYRMCGTRITG